MGSLQYLPMFFIKSTIATWFGFHIRSFVLKDHFWHMSMQETPNIFNVLLYIYPVYCVYVDILLKNATLSKVS